MVSVVLTCYFFETSSFQKFECIELIFTKETVKFKKKLGCNCLLVPERSLHISVQYYLKLEMSRKIGNKKINVHISTFETEVFF